MADIRSEKTTTTESKYFELIKQVVFGISLSVIKVLFSLTEYIH